MYKQAKEVELRKHGNEKEKYVTSPFLAKNTAGIAGRMSHIGWYI